jgi:VWFA-related protein
MKQLVGLLAMLLAAAAMADEPIPVDIIEHERVRLVILDVVVVDKDGRTVPGLAREDFELTTDGKVRPADTLDVSCPGGAVGEPRAVGNPAKRTPAAPATGRKIVLALDYQHLYGMQRTRVLEQARAMVERGADPADEIMVVALTGGLRLEQPFTSDHEAVRRTLRRMEYDLTLYTRDFEHLTETGFVESLHALFDVLGTLPGTKALVLYSAMRDIPLDVQFRELAASASAARCSIYPVDANGFMEPGATPPSIEPG